ncbi:MAG: hypothetical protein ACR2OR_03945 [Hyphomicrobiales bacterium]
MRSNTKTNVAGMTTRHDKLNRQVLAGAGVLAALLAGAWALVPGFRALLATTYDSLHQAMVIMAAYCF